MLALAPFEGQSVSLQVEQCLNGRHKEAGCRRCADACPTQAIMLYPQNERSPHGPLLPQLNVEACVRCGLCLHACPTDVFSQSNPPEVKLAQTISNLPDAPLALACSQHPDPAMTTAPVAAVVRHQRCLASLSLSHLIDLSHNGQRELWLDDTSCAECPIGHVQPFIVQTAAAANRLLQAFDRSSAIHTLLSQPELLAAETSPKPLFEGNQPKLSRRGLFSALGKVTQPAKPNTDPSSQPSTSGPVPVSQRLPHHLPASRQRLRQQLAHLGEPVEESLEIAGLPFANVKIDANACSACHLCARFCPTEALHFVADAESFGISFKVAICLDCRICVVACPENAVSFGSQLPTMALVADKANWLVVGQLTICAGCGEPMALKDNESGGQLLCYSCRQSGGPMQPLKDTAGLMADLLKKKL
ncbi:MAG: 4Fe-4S dicluster domain-containing protein [Anaerolineales bacterium]|nr:4Fe-4S dicluster domain-containing protein [Anaerolineales bacterium]